MAAANIITKRVLISSADGWVRLADEPTVVDVDIRAPNTTVALRAVNPDNPDDNGALLSNASYRFYGVDLAGLEVSTSSGVPLTIHIIAQSTGYRR